MNEWMVKVWGGAWNKDASPSIEKDYGIAEDIIILPKKKQKISF